MALNDNERRACDAVARCLELSSGFTRSNAYSPEDKKVGSPVEYVFELGETMYALEHTTVEAFDGQIRTGVHFDNFVRLIMDALDYRMPKPGSFRLMFGTDPSNGLKRADLSKVQTAIIAWVETVAKELHDEYPEPQSKDHDPRGHDNSRKAVIEGVEVTLWRWAGWWMPDSAKGRLIPYRFAPLDYQALRVKRLEQAMDAKLPKLQAWSDRGACSVLVLENGDIALSNHAVIQEAARDALKGRPYAPNQIWLVDTTIAKEWTVWCLMRESAWFPDESKPIRFRDFSPKELTEV